MVWDSDEVDNEPYNWRELAVSVCDRNIITYEHFIKLPYYTAMEFMMAKNKSIQRENKQYKDV